MNGEKTAAEAQLKKIDEFYYGRYINGEEVAEEVVEFCETAKQHYDQMKAAQEEVDRIKAENEQKMEAAIQPEQEVAAKVIEKEKICSACGEKNAAATKFCQNCGNKLEEPVVQVAAKFCTSCGNKIEGGIKFCPECGQKLEHFLPGENWSFLGFQYSRGVIDISPIAVRKLMDKVRRYSRSLRRWGIKNKVSQEKLLVIFNRKFNRKFYDTQSGRQLCWCRWYFPMINTDQTLHLIDFYLQDWQRYLVTGKHNKANYRRVSYELLKECGYRPLVAAYYKRKDTLA